MIERGDVAEIEVEGSEQRWFALTRDLPALSRAGRAPVSFARDDAAVAVRLPALVPRPCEAALRPRLPHRGLHTRATSACTVTTRCRSSITAISSAASTPRPTDSNDGSRCATRTSSRGSRRRGAPPGGENAVDQAEAIAGLAEALHSLGVFVGGDEIALRRVTPHRLRAPLARALRAARPTNYADLILSPGATGGSVRRARGSDPP